MPVSKVTLKRIDPNTRKRAVVWRLRLEDGVDPVTGKRKWKSLGTYPSERAAQLAEADAVLKREQGTLVEPSRVTVADVLDTWLDSRRGNLNSNSCAEYDGAIRLHLKPALGSMAVQKLQHMHIQRVVNTWTAAGMGARLVHRNVSVLRQALAQAVKGKLIHGNPTDGIEKPSIRKKRTLTVWTDDQTAAFLDASEDDSLFPLWHLLALEGMRRGEALGLRWSDLYWHGDRVTAHIQQTVIPDVSNKGKAVIQPRTKTQSGARTVELTPSTVKALETHRDRQRFLLQSTGQSWSETGLIITTSKGTVVNPSSIKRNQTNLMRRAGVLPITTHDLRHVAATQMILAGVPVVIVSHKLGHAAVSITLDLYAHVLPSDQSQANAAMEALLARGRANNAAIGS